MLLLLAMPFATANMQDELYNATLILWHPDGAVTVDNSSNGFTGTANNVDYSTDNPLIGAAKGNWDAETDYVMFNETYLNTIESFSVCAWVQNTDSNDDSGIVSSYNGVDDGFIIKYRDGDDEIQFEIFNTDGGPQIVEIVVDWTPYITGAPFFICGVLNDTGTAFNFELYINGSLIGSQSHPEVLDMNLAFQIGAQDSKLAIGSGSIEEVMLFNRSLYEVEIDFLYELGKAGDYLQLTYEEENEAPTVPVLNGTQNRKYNHNITFNITESEDAEGDSLTYRWYVNSSLVQVNGTEYTTNMTDGWYAMMVNVTDDNSVVSSNIMYFGLDTEPPLINIYDPDVEDAVFSHVYSLELPIWAECEDDNLLRFNYTITAMDISYENNTANLTYMLLNNTENISAHADGEYNITFLCADSHTKKYIKNKVVIKDDVKKSIRWKNTDDFNEIEIYPDEAAEIDDYYTMKQFDRYMFSYKFKTKTGSYIFNLKAKGLRYLGITTEAGYSPHFISASNWIDFALDVPASYIVEKITDEHYKITVIADTKDLYFNSVGDLNVKQESQLFIKDTVAPWFSSQHPDSNTTGTTYTPLDVNFQYIPVDNNTVSACYLYINGTIVQTDETPDNNLLNTFTYEFNTSAYINWTVECEDSEGNTNATPILWYTVNMLEYPDWWDTEEAGDQLPLADIVSLGAMIVIAIYIISLAIKAGGKKK